MTNSRVSPAARARWVLAAMFASGATLPAQRTPPPTPRTIVTDRYPGRVVSDPYRWMEGATPSPRFLTWLTAQNVHTDSVLAQMPGRDMLRARLLGFASPDTAPRRVRRGGDRLYYLRPSLAGPSSFRSFDLTTYRERVWAIDGSVAQHDPSPDGRWIAITHSDGRVRLFDAVRTSVVDSIGAGSSFAGWHPSSSAFWVARGVTLTLQGIGERAGAITARVRSAAAGAPSWRATDAIEMVVSAAGDDVAMLIRRDDAGHAVYRAAAARDGSPKGPWRLAATAVDGIEAVYWHGHVLVLRSGAGIVSTASTRSGHTRDTLLDARRQLIAGVTVASDGLYVLTGTGGRAQLLRRPSPSASLDSVPLPIDGVARTLVGSAQQRGVVLPLDRWLGDGAWFAVGDGDARRVPLAPAAPDTRDYVEERRLVRTADGAAVPLTILRRRDLVGAPRVTWLMAYGAYGIAMTPLYQSLGGALRPFLDDGNVYAVAHVRGGGEYGTQWHETGRGANKPNGYRDLIACAEALVHSGLARPSRLVVEGSSGGGATVGMAAVTRPDLFAVVLTHVPDANTLRLHATPDGPYMREEWGDIRNRPGASALAAMDVTQHVRAGVSYPAWFVSTGLLDTSVPPWMPAKLAATLQHAGTKRPVVLRVHAQEGHTLRPGAQAEAIVDAVHFAYAQLGQVFASPVRPE
jgi:prolyl oligopeptidase